LSVSVSTTGTLEPRGKVEVGPQISGRIASVHADFNDEVKKASRSTESNRRSSPRVARATRRAADA
jgi:hypothetical protein